MKYIFGNKNIRIVTVIRLLSKIYMCLTCNMFLEHYYLKVF